MSRWPVTTQHAIRSVRGIGYMFVPPTK